MTSFLSINFFYLALKMENTNNAIEFLKNTFTRSEQVKYSDNPSGCDKIVIHKSEFYSFVAEQEKRFLCSFIKRTSGGRDRPKKNEAYLAGIQVEKRQRVSGRPPALFSEVKSK